MSRREPGQRPYKRKAKWEATRRQESENGIVPEARDEQSA